MEFKLAGKLSAGRLTLGVWVTVPEPEISEALSALPLDWLVFDLEHAPITLRDLEHMMMPLRNTGVSPIVRVPWNDQVVIKQVLDLGAEGIIVPFVNSRAEAEAAVKASRYPPSGVRGFGPRRAVLYGQEDARSYVEASNEGLVVIPQVETRGALERVEEIVGVEGVAGVFLGPMDLTMSMGIFAEFGHPEYERAVDRVLGAARSRGKVAGIYAPNPASAVEYARRGFNFISIGSDIQLLLDSARQALDSVRGAVEG